MISPNLPNSHEEITAFLSNFKFLSACCTLLFSLVVTLVVMPKVILISKKKNLTALPNNRTSHSGIVPTLGGIGVFTGLLLTVNIVAVLFASYTQVVDLLIFNILVLMLLLVGIFDDIINLAARRKFLYQIIIALIFVISTNIRIQSFGGLFGIGSMPYILSVVFSVFVIVLIINAYNLIDGIDGLAGALGTLISMFMAVVFFNSGHFFYSLMSISLIGGLVGFLVYNFSHRRKIFLGDTGSMVVGFVLAFQVILYLQLSITTNDMVVFANAPIFVLALLSYPLIDTLRVFTVRILNKRSPFSADRRHIHHRLLDLGLRHIWATVLVAIYTIMITCLAFVLNDLPINTAFCIMLPVAIGMLMLPFCVQRKGTKWSMGLPNRIRNQVS
ncbi:MraY family glycosyltransferase [Bizionia paragorgiae]|uniref:UDP-N-acetylmuramyl pentapeptide phosphotransferase/UDP-N-acetylglucosamine-1-phosphate transferase n=1 Tax=Bizionia paragorgiae TaxID=283786 RepID=A0A1H4BCH9_BIZPA|nr:MraY family glycosyltransferase [Bizionia paragorgiae]SEA45831.1 UDP-N-acetylmuramyl pentapeptide phosphotransferase/UDP-N-acetylglucosamine-1-phosphate transferase [Bizionia paragorgiae]